MYWAIQESIIKLTYAFFFYHVSSFQYCSHVSRNNSVKDLKTEYSKEQTLLRCFPPFLCFVENEILNDNTSQLHSFEAAFPKDRDQPSRKAKEKEKEKQFLN